MYFNFYYNIGCATDYGQKSEKTVIQLVKNKFLTSWWRGNCFPARCRVKIFDFAVGSFASGET